MTQAQGDVLRPLLLNGTPDPLAGLSIGTFAVIDAAARITVFAPMSDHSWTLSAQAQWPDERRPVRNVWGAVAPDHQGSVVVLNLSVVDISGLPEPVQWCLRLQNSRHGLRPLSTSRGFPHRAVLREGVLTFTGLERMVRIGSPYTATEAAYREQFESGFGFLSPALQAVARVVSCRGPISRADLADELYGEPSDSERGALDMTLTRLRRHPRVRLERGADGRLTIELVAPAQDCGRGAGPAVVMAS